MLAYGGTPAASTLLFSSTYKTFFAVVCQNCTACFLVGILPNFSEIRPIVCEAIAQQKHLHLAVVLILSTIVLEMRTVITSVGDLLFGQTRGRVLALLYGAPDESFFVRQIARQIETSVGSVQRELSLLADAGLVNRSVLGNQVFFQANQEHPDFPELRALLVKTMGVFQMLKTALAPLASRIDLAFVYGSVARGEDKATSDIDLMVIGSVSLDDVLDAVGPLEKQLRRPVNPTIYSREDLKKRLHEGNHFLQSLMDSQKVFLIGDENEYREACTIRVVQG